MSLRILHRRTQGECFEAAMQESVSLDFGVVHIDIESRVSPLTCFDIFNATKISECILGIKGEREWETILPWLD